MQSRYPQKCPTPDTGPAPKATDLLEQRLDWLLVFVGVQGFALIALAVYMVASGGYTCGR